MLHGHNDATSWIADLGVDLAMNGAAPNGRNARLRWRAGRSGSSRRIPSHAADLRELRGENALRVLAAVEAAALRRQ